VPALRACDHFHLTAEAVLRGRELTVAIQSGDPIFPATELARRYDSKLEERFSLEFRKLAPEFDLVREPEAVPAGNHLIFPDFAIFRRRDPTRRVLLEIVGFWTPSYLSKKLERVRAAGVGNLVLCIDEFPELRGRDAGRCASRAPLQAEHRHQGGAEDGGGDARPPRTT